MCYGEEERQLTTVSITVMSLVIGSLVSWSCSVNERNWVHNLWKSNMERMDFYRVEDWTKRLLVLGVWRLGYYVGPCTWWARWRVRCFKRWERGLLGSEWGQCRLRIAHLTLLVSCPLGIVKLLLVSGATWEVGWMVTATVGTFWGGASRFCAVFGCMG